MAGSAGGLSKTTASTTIPADPPVFDPTGRVIAMYAESGRPDVWDVRTGELVSTLAEQPGDVYGLAFSSDASFLATASQDGSVRLFDPLTGLQRLVLHGPSPANGVAFSSDGSMLASIGGTGVRVWALEIDRLIESAERNVTRSLTNEECRQYLHLECPVDAAAEA